MPCDVKNLLGITRVLSMSDSHVTILMNGGGTTLDGEEDMQMVPWLNLDNVGV